MKTPEEIAVSVETEAVKSPSWPVFTVRESLVVHQLVVQAATEAWRSAYREGLKDGPQPREPQFAPEGEPDDWRDDAGNIDDTDSIDVGWTVLAANGTLMFNTDFTISAVEARHFLAYLSEQSRAES